MRVARVATKLATTLATVLLAAPLGADASNSLSGVCPDGSMFIVQKEADIPCREAKLVEPHEMPPVRPEFLPRPYGWQVHQERQDPNNPYNLIDDARTIRGVEDEPEAAFESPRPTRELPTPSPSPAPEMQTAGVPAVSAAPPAPTRLELSNEEMHDLALIVELTQQLAPATFRPGASDAPPVQVQLAHSRAFEARVRDFWAGRAAPLLGPVVLFVARAESPAAFRANFTFAQGHMAFHPQPEDPRQMAILDGELGTLGAGESVLGYVVLPGDADLERPMDVYWNDRMLAATLRP